MECKVLIIGSSWGSSNCTHRSVAGRGILPSISGAFLRAMFPILIWPRFPSSGTQDVAESASSPECQAQPHHLFRVCYCSLPIKGPSIFNSLLRSVRNITGCNVETFKAGLDRYLTFVSDEPLITEYTHYRGTSSNSVRDRPWGSVL